MEGVLHREDPRAARAPWQAPSTRACGSALCAAQCTRPATMSAWPVGPRPSRLRRSGPKWSQTVGMPRAFAISTIAAPRSMPAPGRPGSGRISGNGRCSSRAPNAGRRPRAGSPAPACGRRGWRCAAALRRRRGRRHVEIVVVEVLGVDAVGRLQVAAVVAELDGRRKALLRRVGRVLPAGWRTACPSANRRGRSGSPRDRCGRFIGRFSWLRRTGRQAWSSLSWSTGMSTTGWSTGRPRSAAPPRARAGGWAGTYAPHSLPSPLAGRTTS